MSTDLTAVQPVDIPPADLVIRRRRLCLPVRPLSAETLSSYLLRVTERNYLKGTMLPKIARLPDRRTILAQLTGHSERHLASALPELRTRADLSRWPYLSGRVSAVAGIRPACTLCVATRAGTPRHIPVFATHDHLICATHHRWVGSSDLRCSPSEQFSILDCADIAAANRAHRALIRRWGRGATRASFSDAERCLLRWSQWQIIEQANGIQRRRYQLAIPARTRWPHAKVIAAYYPTAVALTRVILAQRHAVAEHGQLSNAIFARGMVEFNQYVIFDFEPSGACDPYRQAILDNRPESDTEVESH